MAVKAINIPKTNNILMLVTKEDGTIDKSFMIMETVYVPTTAKDPLDSKVVDLKITADLIGTKPQGDPSETDPTKKACYPIYNSRGQIIGWKCV
jgi:hypothetical protein